MKHIFLWCLMGLVAPLAQAQDFKTGLAFDDDADTKTEKKAPLMTRDYQVLPAKTSLRNFTPVILAQQGGTCVGWSSTYYGRTILEAKGKNLSDKMTISNEAFAPYYTYTMIKNHQGCEEGTVIPYALQLLVDKGAPKKNDFHVTCPTSIPDNIIQKAAAYKIKSFARLYEADDDINFQKNAMKKSLANGNPVIIGMKCPDSFFGAKGFWQPKEDPNGNFGGHAMCVIGYDDSMYGGSFEIINSWGTSWGNEGFIWIKYADFFAFTKYAYEMIALPTNKPPTENDMAGEIAFKLSTGANMQATYVNKTGSLGYYKVNQPYTSGTQFRIMISNNEPAFVYAFGSDLTNEIFTIFPHKEGISAALNYASNNVALPDEQHFIRMNETTGKDFMCVLYSKEKLDIEEIKQNIAAQTGTFAQKVQKALASDLVSTANIQYQSSQMKFTAKSQGKSIAALIVEIEHQ